MPDASRPIAILLPVFNGAPFLREQIDSILAQTHSDFALLAYDDGSTDGSGDILRAYVKADARVQMIDGECNSGQRTALRKLLEQTNSRLLMFSDQDDIWHPRKIETLLTALGDASLSYGTSHLIDDAGKDIGKTIFDFNGAALAGTNCADFFFRNVVSGHAMLVRREVVDAGVFLFNAPYDWLIALLATFSGGVVYAPDAVVYHRQHANNQLNKFGEKAERGGGQSKRWHRIMRLHDGLAVLRAASSIAVEKRLVFDRLYRALCDQVILKPVRGVYDGAFAAIFIAGLRQLQITQAERSRAGRAISKICRGPLHPKTIYDALRQRFKSN